MLNERTARSSDFANGPRSMRGCLYCSAPITLFLFGIVLYDLMPAFTLAGRRERFKEIARVGVPRREVLPRLERDYVRTKSKYAGPEEDVFLINSSGSIILMTTSGFAAVLNGRRLSAHLRNLGSDRASVVYDLETSTIKQLRFTSDGAKLWLDHEERLERFRRSSAKKGSK